MKRTSILLISLSLIAFALPVTADHGTSSGGGACETDADAVAVGSFWVSPGPAVYEESNNADGLQRGGDDSQVIPDFPDVGDCTHPDTIIV